MPQIIIYELSDGTIQLGNPAPNSNLTIAEIAEKDKPTGATVTLIDDTALPAQTTYQEAWRINNGVVSIDMTTAKAKRLNELRLLRDARLEALDLDFMKALEDGASTTAITAEKVTLRDFPATENFTGITDIDSLIAYVPTLLQGV